MSGSIKVQQDGNVVSGHQAGRDINIQTIVNQQQQQGSLMRTLIAKYREEIAANPEFRLIIEELQHYLANIDEDTPKVVGLEVKLQDAGRQDETKRAVKLKEMFVKKLERHCFSETAQHIYAFVLGRLHQLFRVEVKPLLYAKADRFSVDRVVLREVLQPVLVELEDNVLLIKPDELEGMLYFLTGNCHLRWNEPC